MTYTVILDRICLAEFILAKCRSWSGGIQIWRTNTVMILS